MALERVSFTDIKLMEFGSAEWIRAWQSRTQITGDDDFEAEDPQTREVWQYMGSVKIAGRWVHQFRHRNHPVTKNRWYVNVPAHPSWSPPPDELADASYPPG